VKTLAMGLASVVAATLASAGPPARISAGRMDSRAAAGGLKAAIEQALREGSEPKWIGYAVESGGEGSACCWNSTREAGGCCGGCRLEREHGDVAFRSDSSTPIALEGPRRVRILQRAQGGRVEQVRAFSEDCALDVGRLTFVWLEGVSPVESVDYLGSLLAGDARGGHGDRDLTNGPLLALSMHAEPRAVDLMLKAARHHASAGVRKQALFWLSQTASRRAGPAIEEAVDDDPDVEVKKQAVFALSQLPPDQGVPHLIRVARTHARREVRKQAIFWLGQSEDARALAFFEEILSR
jgi:hypothetical protein